jgi:hypothetical protein
VEPPEPDEEVLVCEAELDPPPPLELLWLPPLLDVGALLAGWLLCDPGEPEDPGGVVVCSVGCVPDPALQPASASAAAVAIATNAREPFHLIARSLSDLAGGRHGSLHPIGARQRTRADSGAFGGRHRR